jgi:hypothetical protein
MWFLRRFLADLAFRRYPIGKRGIHASGLTVEKTASQTGCFPSNSVRGRKIRVIPQCAHRTTG